MRKPDREDHADRGRPAAGFRASRGETLFGTGQDRALVDTEENCRLCDMLLPRHALLSRRTCLHHRCIRSYAIRTSSAASSLAIR
jgi:hypothetical protein